MKKEIDYYRTMNIKQELLDRLYQDLQERLSLTSDSSEMKLVYRIVALELTIESECNK